MVIFHMKLKDFIRYSLILYFYDTHNHKKTIFVF